MSLIYVIKNRNNGKCYVGQTTQSLGSRLSAHLWDSHNGSNYHIHRAINKYGWKNFTIVARHVPVDNINEAEKYYINKYDSFYKGYNMTMGGKGQRGFVHSKETKDKISLKKLGHKQSKETIMKRATALKGKYCDRDNIHSKPIYLIDKFSNEEFFYSMSEACRKYNLNNGHLTAVAKGKENSHKGYRVRYATEETTYVLGNSIIISRNRGKHLGLQSVSVSSYKPS